MARNGSGTYSNVNTFVSGATITAAGFNQNFSDLGSEMTNSVAVDGQSTMTGPLKAANGTVGAPAYTFGSDQDSGWYRIGADNWGLALAGAKVLDVATTGLSVTGTLSASGAVSLAGNLSVTGTLGVTSDFAINTNKFTVTATNGNTAVAGTLNVTGGSTISSLAMSGNLDINTNKFNVTAANGNTAIAGTLAVTGDATLTASISAATAAGAMVATQANMETGSATNLLVSPGRQHYHAGHPKAWALVDQTGTMELRGSYNVSSVTDGGTGITTVNHGIAFSNSDTYAGLGAMGDNNVGNADYVRRTTHNTTTYTFKVQLTGTGADGDYIGIAFVGDL